MEEAGAGRAGRPSAERTRVRGRDRTQDTGPVCGHEPTPADPLRPARTWAPTAGAEEEQETKRGPRGCGGTGGARERAPCCSTADLLSDCAPRPGRHVEGSLTAQGDPGRVGGKDAGALRDCTETALRTPAFTTSSACLWIRRLPLALLARPKCSVSPD